MPRLSTRDLATIGWSIRQLAAACGWSDFTLRRMIAGERETPPELAAWLHEAADWHRAHPVPRREL